MAFSAFILEYFSSACWFLAYSYTINKNKVEHWLTENTYVYLPVLFGFTYYKSKPMLFMYEQHTERMAIEQNGPHIKIFKKYLKESGISYYIL